MQIRKQGCGFVTKCCLFIVLTIFSITSYAEYYLVYPGPQLVCNSPCCYRSCYKKVYRKHFVRRFRVKHFVKRCYYHRPHRIIRPCYRLACVHHLRRGCCLPPVAPFSCHSCYRGAYGFVPGYWWEAEPRDYSNIYPDQATGDDNPMFYPELNIDR